MVFSSDHGVVIVTGAGGHIGREVCRLFRAAHTRFLPVDVDFGAATDSVRCDLTQKDQVARLFQSHPVRAVIHLAAILPSAFQSNPFAGVDLNLHACLDLLRQAVDAKVRRFVFASSMSVYGSSLSSHALTEGDPAAPDDSYGAAKRAVESVGETLAKAQAIEFVSLRIARVIGPGIKKTSSPWRSQIFEAPAGSGPVRIPFAPDAALSLVHAEDVARMLVTLADAPIVCHSIYNTPVETWKAIDLKKVIEDLRGVRVELEQNGTHAGPLCDGSRFAAEFGFQLRGLRERLSLPLD